MEKEERRREDIRFSISVRSYFMQGACSANRKKCHHLHFQSTRGYELLRARTHAKAFNKISFPLACAVSRSANGLLYVNGSMLPLANTNMMHSIVSGRAQLPFFCIIK